jgi:hypothetical protein
MPSKGIVLGPFSGGANTASDPSAIEDNELAECVNLELDLNGSLVARPPYVASAGPSGNTSGLRAIGNAVFGTDSYIIFGNAAGVWAFRLGDLAWITITTLNLNPTACVQYNDKVWIVARPGTINSGGSWSPTSSFSSSASMPKGGACVIYKERMWIAPGYDATTSSSRLYFSNIANPGNWTTTTDFYDVSPGDGQKLIDLAIYNNNLVIFKEDSTYTLAYDTSPSDAILIKINNTIGASRQFCVVSYERSIFVLHGDKLYEIVNYNFSQINVKFVFDAVQKTPGTYTEDIFISLLANRIVVRYFENMYVYNLDTNTWSKWNASHADLQDIGPIVEHPNVRSSLSQRIFRAGCNKSSLDHIVSIKESHDNITVERNEAGSAQTITCYVVTKNYDFGVSYVYKRMNFWGVDVTTSKSISGIATPIVFGEVVTWGSLTTLTWNSLGSWLNPTTLDPSVTTTVGETSGSLRRFVKFLKGLRFRQIKFKVQMTTDGTLLDGPCRLYTITVFAASKQHVSKSVS